jgi:branched-chain amino acid transport system substrate-binding protein
MVRRLGLLVLVIGIGTALLFILYRSLREDSDKTVVIGAVLPMTGDAGTFGQNAFRGAELAIEEENKNGGLDGKNIELRVEDSRGNAQAAAEAARKLLDIDGAIGIIGDVTSAGTHAIVPIATRKGVLVVSPAASDPALSGVSPFFVRLWPSDVYEAAVIGDYARSKDFHNVFIVYANTDYGIGMQRQFTKVFDSQRIAASVAIEREALDYRPMLQRVKAVPADSLFIVLYPEDARRFLQQANEQGLNIPVLATATIEDPQIAKLPYASNLIFASPLPPDEDNSARKNFLHRYTAKFASEPGVLSDVGYDSATLLVRSLRHEGLSKPERAGSFIKSLQNYKGVSGDLSFLPSGDVRKPYGLKGVKDNRFYWLPEQRAK